MLALSGQKGDWAIRTDTGSTWVIVGTNPSLIGSWVELATPADAVSSVNGYTGSVTLGHADVAALALTGGSLSGNVTSSADISAVNLAGSGNLTIVGITASGTVTGANLSTAGNLTTVGITASGNIGCVDLTASGDVSVTGTLSAGTIDGGVYAT